MANPLKRVTTLIEQDLPGARVHPFSSPDFQDDNVRGFVVWDGFHGIEEGERQRQVDRALRSLPEDDQLQIMWLLTSTPEEYASYSGPSVAEVARR